ncbi:hypothetical protein ACOTHJ_21365 [Achromobacter xylosoxidans]|uniref:hypothetical protein n=1 Tax=Alcaligenes xylosoxydans xylosoxydans TaxID=85698 RepID=UPI0006C4586F|nr:hypothetical protein [Achromobacter xylosoxidans]CUJ58757.1 Uncharacterised protein [Achromobacter xylosoxidans]
MIRRLLRALLGLDRYEWVGIAGAVVLAATVGVLGPTLDSQSNPYPTCEGCGKTAVAARQP